MAVIYYPAVLERGEHGFGVFFPDLPGCVSAGETAAEAARNAEEALNGHLAELAAGGDDIPAPNAVDAIERDPDVDVVALLLVRGETPSKAVRVQISIDESLLARIDRVAANRSRFLADAARGVLAMQDA